MFTVSFSGLCLHGFMPPWLHFPATRCPYWAAWRASLPQPSANSNAVRFLRFLRWRWRRAPPLRAARLAAALPAAFTYACGAAFCRRLHHIACIWFHALPPSGTPLLGRAFYTTAAPQHAYLPYCATSPLCGDGIAIADNRLALLYRCGPDNARAGPRRARVGRLPPYGCLYLRSPFTIPLPFPCCRCNTLPTAHRLHTFRRLPHAPRRCCARALRLFTRAPHRTAQRAFARTFPTHTAYHTHTTMPLQEGPFLPHPAPPHLPAPHLPLHATTPYLCPPHTFAFTFLFTTTCTPPCHTFTTHTCTTHAAFTLHTCHHTLHFLHTHCCPLPLPLLPHCTHTHTHTTTHTHTPHYSSFHHAFFLGLVPQQTLAITGIQAGRHLADYRSAGGHWPGCEIAPRFSLTGLGVPAVCRTGPLPAPRARCYRAPTWRHGALPGTAHRTACPTTSILANYYCRLLAPLYCLHVPFWCGTVRRAG